MCYTSKFHLNALQYSVRGDVMLDDITYGKDCILHVHAKHLRYLFDLQVSYWSQCGFP